jgi:hypothetical protein
LRNLQKPASLQAIRSNDLFILLRGQLRLAGQRLTFQL